MIPSSTKTKKGFVSIVTMCLLASALIGCHDFFERNIEDSVVVVNTPAEGSSSPLYLQRFRWETVNGAREYHIMLATPSFDNLKQVIIDTIVTSNSFDITLTPQKYQMSIVAQNAGYQSKKTTVSFEITESYDLSIQDMNPKSPANRSYTNSSSIGFSWDALKGAESYILEIFDADGKSIAGVIPTTSNHFTIPSATPEISSLTEQAYSWRIYAKNEISESKAALSYFTIDRTAPAALKKLTPNAIDTSRSVSVAFSWTKQADTGSPIIDSIIISGNQSLSPVLVKSAVTNGSYSYTFANTSSTYYWKVIQTDAAGNRAESDVRKILVIPN